MHLLLFNLFAFSSFIIHRTLKELQNNLDRALLNSALGSKVFLYVFSHMFFLIATSSTCHGRKHIMQACPYRDNGSKAERCGWEHTDQQVSDTTDYHFKKKQKTFLYIHESKCPI